MTERVKKGKSGIEFFNGYRAGSERTVYRFLESHPGEWFTKSEIADALPIKRSTVSHACWRVQHHPNIERRVNSNIASYRYVEREA